MASVLRLQVKFLGLSPRQGHCVVSPDTQLSQFLSLPISTCTNMGTGDFNCHEGHGDG